MNITALNKCANCGACSAICPKRAIFIEKDGLFYTPTVNQSLCVDCGLCVDVCPVKGEISTTLPIAAYAGWHKQELVVQSSSSGGVFYGLAHDILANGGVAFGAAYSDDYKTVSITSTDDVVLSQLQKSKYVESLVGDSFVRVKQALESGRRVLFCGTPCQVAGLKAFLKKDHHLLLTCDFACGGLPSHIVYRDYLRDLEEKYGAAVTSVDFRPKTHGWKRYAVLVRFKNSKRYLRLGVEDAYLRSFLYGKYTVRDYCMDCKFAEKHASDLTVADFWLHHKLSDLENPDGISLVLCNTPKGQTAIRAISDQYELQMIDVAASSYNNKPVNTANQDRERRAAFLKEYEKKGLASAYKQAFSDPLQYRLKNWIVRNAQRKNRGKK